MKRFASFSMALLMLLAAMPAEGSEQPEVTILFTNNANGKLKDCNCRNDPFGGLAERVSLITAYRREHPDIIVVDSGGAVGLSDDVTTGTKVFDLLRRMRYDAVGVGDQEVYRGLGIFLDRYGSFKDLFVNASFRNNRGEAVFEPYRLVTVDGIRIGITGLVSDETFRFFPDSSRDFTYLSPDSALASIMPALMKSSDFIVVLSQLGVEGDKVLAAKWPGIGFIAGGHSQTLLAEPVRTGKTVIGQTGKNGGRVGEVVLRRGQNGTVVVSSYRLIEVTKKYTIPPEIQVLLNGPASPETNMGARR
jgi:2',3'-cyclic-nucleotide 2'-phosphodiesterase (5'-nucleotidase family)